MAPPHVMKPVRGAADIHLLTRTSLIKNRTQESEKLAGFLAVTFHLEDSLLTMGNI